MSTFFNLLPGLFSRLYPRKKRRAATRKLFLRFEFAIIFSLVVQTHSRQVFGSRLGPRRDISPLPAVQNIHCPRPVRNPVAFDLDTRLLADTVPPKPLSHGQPSASALSCPGRPRPSRSQLPKRVFSSCVVLYELKAPFMLCFPGIRGLRTRISHMP